MERECVRKCPSLFWIGQITISHRRINHKIKYENGGTSIKDIDSFTKDGVMSGFLFVYLSKIQTFIYSLVASVVVGLVQF